MTFGDKVLAVASNGYPLGEASALSVATAKASNTRLRSPSFVELAKTSANTFSGDRPMPSCNAPISIASHKATDAGKCIVTVQDCAVTCRVRSLASQTPLLLA